MTTDVDEQQDPEPAAPAEITAGQTEARREARTRLFLPLAIPLLAIGAVAVLAINLSRVFLAGGKLGALLGASLITLAVLGGAAWLSASPKLRSSSLTLIASTVVVLVIGAGLTTLGAADDHHHEAAGYQEPEGEPTSVIETTALRSLLFDPANLSAPAGIIQIDLLQQEGAGHHDLVFDDSELSGFQLVVPEGPTSGKIELAEGSYDFYCSVPGHRAAGMEGTLAITASEGDPEPTDGEPTDGEVDGGDDAADADGA